MVSRIELNKWLLNGGLPTAFPSRTTEERLDTEKDGADAGRDSDSSEALPAGSPDDGDAGFSTLLLDKFIISSQAGQRACLPDQASLHSIFCPQCGQVNMKLIICPITTPSGQCQKTCNPPCPSGRQSPGENADNIMMFGNRIVNPPWLAPPRSRTTTHAG